MKRQAEASRAGLAQSMRDNFYGLSSVYRRIFAVKYTGSPPCMALWLAAFGAHLHIMTHACARARKMSAPMQHEAWFAHTITKHALFVSFA